MPRPARTTTASTTSPQPRCLHPVGLHRDDAQRRPDRPGQTFLGLRSWYKNDPNWSKVQTYLDGGALPSFSYHRFWAQVDVALALVDYGTLFPNG